MTAGSISPPYIIPLRVGNSQKSFIDTNTLIEIRSDTNDVDIYYTLDGSKPDAFIKLTTRRSTIQYKKPFYIPRELTNEGKITVKALAITRDGIRESVVGTKTFDIKLVPSDHSQSDEYENRFLYELQQERQDLMRKIHNADEQKFSESMHRSTTDSFVQEKPPRYTHPDSQTPANRFQKQSDILRCSHCFALKTTISYTRFCTECGLPWQKLTRNPSDIPSVRTCSNCQSTIPFHSDTCVVCETSSSTDNQRRVNVQNQTTILCPKCKSSNPIHLRTCYICESKLMPTSTPPIRASVSVPSKSSVTELMMTCSKCFRLNNADARFCDWCGAQPDKASLPIQCTKCRASNDPHAKFCSTCGCVMEPPLRVIDARLRNDVNLPATSMIAGTLTRHSTNPTWLNVSPTVSHYRQPNGMTKCEAATQTYGIYYPSAKDLDLLITQNKQLLADREFKEHRPVLTAISPGKGYWIQQLDHICAHLKAYAVNRPDFRALIGEPRMGKMVHTTVHDDAHNITVAAVFSKPENLSQSTFYSNETNTRYSMNSERSSAFSSAFNSDDEYTREKTQRTKVKKREKKRPQSATSFSNDSPKHALIKLLEKPEGDHNKKSSYRVNVLDEVRRLLREGADANAINHDRFTVLQLAVCNGHNDCLETLIVDGKAKLDKPGPKGTTALHECCRLGIHGVEPLRILLEHGGNVSWMNDKKETVADLASKESCQELSDLIASQYGQRMINRQNKTYYDDYARTTTGNGHRSSKKS